MADVSDAITSTQQTQKQIDGMRVLIACLVHQLGGSAMVDEVEVVRVIDKRITVEVTQDDRRNFYLKEVENP